MSSNRTTHQSSNSRLVYSTSAGRICPGCRRPRTDCVCSKKHPTTTEKNDGIVRIRLETKGRKGKGVTTITGVPLEGDALKKLAKQIKNQCGSGGTLKDSVIEIQGDHRQTIQTLLEKQGMTVKLAGG